MCHWGGYPGSDPPHQVVAVRLYGPRFSARPCPSPELRLGPVATIAALATDRIRRDNQIMSAAMERWTRLSAEGGKPRNRAFLTNHVRDLVAIDFFTVPTAGLRVLSRLISSFGLPGLNFRLR